MPRRCGSGNGGPAGVESNQFASCLADAALFSRQKTNLQPTQKTLTSPCSLVAYGKNAAERCVPADVHPVPVAVDKRLPQDVAIWRAAASKSPAICRKDNAAKSNNQGLDRTEVSRLAKSGNLDAERLCSIAESIKST